MILNYILKLDVDDIMMNMPGWSVLCRVCATFKRSFEKMDLSRKSEWGTLACDVTVAYPTLRELERESNSEQY